MPIYTNINGAQKELANGGGVISDSDRCRSVTLKSGESVQMPGNVIVFTIDDLSRIALDTGGQCSNIFYYYKNTNELIGTYMSSHGNTGSAPLNHYVNISNATLDSSNNLNMDLYLGTTLKSVTVCTISNALLTVKLYPDNDSINAYKNRSITINYMVLS